MAEGRAAAATMEVDVAVVGIFLPDGNGVELVRELRQADRRHKKSRGLRDPGPIAMPFLLSVNR